MAKRKLLQWMREQLKEHAAKVVTCSAEKKVLDAAYKKAAPLVAAIITAKFPTTEMKILAKWKSASVVQEPKLSIPSGAIVAFKFAEGDCPARPSGYDFDRQIFIAGAPVAAAVERWLDAAGAYGAERKKTHCSLWRDDRRLQHDRRFDQHVAGSRRCSSCRQSANCAWPRTDCNHQGRFTGAKSCLIEASALSPDFSAAPATSLQR